MALHTFIGVTTIYEMDGTARAEVSYTLEIEGEQVVGGLIRDVTRIWPNSVGLDLIASGPEHWLALEVCDCGWVQIQITTSEGDVSPGRVIEPPNWTRD